MDGEAAAVFEDLDSAFRTFEQEVPPPQRVKYRDGFVVRFVERTPHQALLLKFARQVSGLRAARMLMENGFGQEQGVLQRTLDEFAEDIIFVSLGLTTGEWTAHHDSYLRHFWADEYAGDEVGQMLARKHIRAFNNRAGGLSDPSSADTVGKTIFRVYSGYVHGAAVNILDMCDGRDLSFKLDGKEELLHRYHVQDFWNYLYRGLVSASFIATAFRDPLNQERRYAAVLAFESQFGSMIFPATP